MDVKALAENFASFMTKHSGELRLVASTLQTIVDHLPIDQQDKARLSEGLGTLQTAAGNIATGASALAGATVEVVIAKDDVVDAVREVVAEETGNAPNPQGNAEGNASNG